MMILSARKNKTAEKRRETGHMVKIVEIDSIGTPELDPFVRLTGHQLRNKLEPDEGIFIVESPIAIDAALDAGCVPIALLTEKKYVHGRMAGIIDRIDRINRIDLAGRTCLAEEAAGPTRDDTVAAEIPVYAADHETLAAITGFALTRGALCAMRRPKPQNWREIVKGASRVAVLENIVDSTNMGAIFRSAAGLGIDAVLLTPECCDPLCRRAVRVSMGTALKVPFARIGNEPGDWPHPMLGELRSAGFRTAAMALRDGAISVGDPVLRNAGRLAVILGTEGDGLKASTIDGSDFVVRIPMARGVDSLNVGAAAAIAFYELSRRDLL